jgi:hypothetical protein
VADATGVPSGSGVTSGPRVGDASVVGGGGELAGRAVGVALAKATGGGVGLGGAEDVHATAMIGRIDCAKPLIQAV